MLHEQQQTITMGSDVRERIHLLVVKTPCSHLHSFCANGVSSGLAIGVTLTRLSLGILGEGVDQLLIFVQQYVTVVVLRFVW
jgi:uncharacterized protein YoaH (UPF0181 family)